MFKWSLLFVISLVFFSCNGDQKRTEADRWLDDQSHIRVLSTIGMIDDLVRVVGAERVNRLTLITGALDPHSYELVKGDDEKLAGADIIFYNGLGLEHGPSLYRYLNESESAVALGDAIIAADPNAVVSIDGEIDPHIWMDASLWVRCVDLIVAELSTLDPEGATGFAARGEELKEELFDLDIQLRAMLAEVPDARRYVVTSHDSCNYFARRYLATDAERIGELWRSRCAAPEGLAPDAQLSLSDIRDVLNHLSAYNIDILFPESNLSQDSIRKIVDAGCKQGLKVRIAQEALYGDSMGENETYASMMLHNARVLRDALR